MAMLRAMKEEVTDISTDYFKLDLQTASAVGHLAINRPVVVKGYYHLNESLLLYKCMQRLS